MSTSSSAVENLRCACIMVSSRNSVFDGTLLRARAGVNNTKQPCPVFNSSAVPAIRPVALPDITALSGGQILVGQQQLPTQIKVCGSSR